MANDAIGRIAERIQQFAQLAKQVTEGQETYTKASREWPARQNGFILALEELTEQLKDYFSEIDIYSMQELEKAEALETLTGRLTDVATILGRHGKNLEVLTHSDADYIHGIIGGATGAALKEAVSKLTPAEYARLAALMKQHQPVERNDDNDARD